MRVTLNRQNRAVHFEAVTDTGGRVPIDGAPAVGGQGLGARPMELLLAGIGGCSGIDIVSILAKMRQPLEDLVITVDAEREEGREPALFTSIHVHFAVTGPCDPERVAHAVQLSMEKYCSVARILEHTAKITWSHSLNGAPGFTPVAA
jgi:putative redox protein